MDKFCPSPVCFQFKHSIRSGRNVEWKITPIYPKLKWLGNTTIDINAHQKIQGAIYHLLKFPTYLSHIYYPECWFY